MKKNEELDDDLNIEEAMEDDGAMSSPGIIGTFVVGVINFLGNFFR
ncbi:hypothetical protein M2118_001452 [Aurantimicrobium minutum]|nr:hypothetical protein [Aurantimicrobium minutum]MDH6278468.1 hypothetical protein [Aurantimicrobium minutum]